MGTFDGGGSATCSGGRARAASHANVGDRSGARLIHCPVYASSSRHAGLSGPSLRPRSRPLDRRRRAPHLHTRRDPTRELPRRDLQGSDRKGDGRGEGAEGGASLLRVELLSSFEIVRPDRAALRLPRVRRRELQAARIHRTPAARRLLASQPSQVREEARMWTNESSSVLCRSREGSGRARRATTRGTPPRRRAVRDGRKRRTRSACRASHEGRRRRPEAARPPRSTPPRTAPQDQAQLCLTRSISRSVGAATQNPSASRCRLAAGRRAGQRPRPRAGGGSSDGSVSTILVVEQASLVLLPAA